MRLLGQCLIQHDQCPYKKGKLGECTEGRLYEDTRRQQMKAKFSQMMLGQVHQSECEPPALRRNQPTLTQDLQPPELVDTHCHEQKYYKYESSGVPGEDSGSTQDSVTGNWREDDPFYKVAEHLEDLCSAGYGVELHS